jgi:hypothetical protein
MDFNVLTFGGFDVLKFGGFNVLTFGGFDVLKLGRFNVMMLRDQHNQVNIKASAKYELQHMNT